MRINTNISALNAQRQLGITNAAVSQSITRLSSGFRINRAADDAGGLGIANKLRGDIRSMTQAARNGEQANSLAQIAEGSVDGIARMLDRMKELATQANSDTVDTAGRGRLQAEFEALSDEINRTALTTQFGQTKLIDGTLGNVGTPAGALIGAALAASVDASGAQAGTYTMTFGTGTLSVTDGAGKTQVLTLAKDGAHEVNFDVFGIKVNMGADYLRATANTATGDIVVAPGAAGGGTFMVGSSGGLAGANYSDASGSGDLLVFKRIDVTAAGLGINALNVSTAASAQVALTGIDTAIGVVSEALGTIGAFQNRIENAVANVRTAIENLSASESVIRDLDMASEMTVFSKNQILQQAGTAMLAQANQSSQTVLQLLRG